MEALTVQRNIIRLLLLVVLFYFGWQSIKTYLDPPKAIQLNTSEEGSYPDFTLCPLNYKTADTVLNENSTFEDLDQFPSLLDYTKVLINNEEFKDADAFSEYPAPETKKMDAPPDLTRCLTIQISEPTDVPKEVKKSIFYHQMVLCRMCIDISYFN